MNVKFLFNALSTIKGKILAVVIIALLSLLTASITLNVKQDKWHKETIVQHAQVVLMNDSLVSSNNSLRDQLKTIPSKSIETVKSIDKELCNGLQSVKDVLSLPSNSKPESKEVQNEKEIVDIDAPLPSDLVKLLNED